MRTLGLRGVRRGRFCPQTTNSTHRLQRAPNRLLQAPPPDRPDRVWVADITFVPNAEGWLYVAGVLDRHSRRLLGLGFNARLDANLPEALSAKSLARRGGHFAAGLLHHRDQGVQYASATYQALLDRLSLGRANGAGCYSSAA